MIGKPANIGCYLNKEHPHADGLVASYLFHEKTGKLVANYCRNETDSLYAEWTPYGAKADSNAKYGVIDNTGEKLINSAKGTIVCGMRSQSAFDEGVLRKYFGNSTSGAGLFRIYKNTGNTLIFMLEDSVGVHWIKNISSSFPNWTTGNQVSFLWNRTQVIKSIYNMVISVDGVHETPNSHYLATGWNAFTVYDTMYQFNDQDLDAHSNSELKYQYIYSKDLSERVLKSIKESPYEMFETPNVLQYLSSTEEFFNKPEMAGATGCSIGIEI